MVLRTVSASFPLAVMLASLGCLYGCGSGESSSSFGAGEATVTMLNQTWSVTGNCEMSGEDLTFVGPGDPMLTIGINTKSNSKPVGNFSSAREGFGVLVGTSDTPEPAVERNGSSFTVTGTFLVIDGSNVDGAVAVDCQL